MKALRCDTTKRCYILIPLMIYELVMPRWKTAERDLLQTI